VVQTLATMFILLLTGNASAQETYGINENVYRVMQEVQQAIDAESYEQALAGLENLRGNRRISEYEMAHSWNLTALVYYQQERYEEAIVAYGNIIDYEQIPDTLRQSSFKAMAQLSLMLERYDDVIRYAGMLNAELGVPDPEIHILIGQAHYHKEEYAAALPAVRQAIESHTAFSSRLRESWLLLLNAVYFGLQDYPGMRSTLLTLIKDTPRTPYLLNLAAVHAELGDFKAQAALMESLYESGLLEQESQLLNLVSLYMLHKIPYKAALLLEREIDSGMIRPVQRNYQYLAQAWQLAGEMDRAIPPLTRVAEMDEDGETWLRLAQIHVGLSRWEKAEELLQRALTTDNLKNPGNANLLLGMARFNQKRFSAARTAFQLAAQDERVAVMARQWLVYLENEQAKYALLAQD
jgi:tetratricopeptide (TPR) repeat protein